MMMMGVDSDSSSSGSYSSVVVAAELWWQTADWGWGWGWGWGCATAVALLFILTWHFTRRFFFVFFYRRSSGSAANSPLSPPSNPRSRVSEIVSDDDLKFLIDNLEEKNDEKERWEPVTERKNDSVYYSAKCCKPESGPLKYLSVTLFQNCSPELLRDFYMENDYRKLWDKTVTVFEQLEVDKSNGTEIGRIIKKFPLLTAREYVLAWRFWEGSDGSFYCFTKECEHSSAPRQRKFVRVGYFRSGWRIRKGKLWSLISFLLLVLSLSPLLDPGRAGHMLNLRKQSTASIFKRKRLLSRLFSILKENRADILEIAVPGQNASEIRMFHQEDAGLNVDMAKLAFSKGIWSYVCKMDGALRKYSTMSHPQRGSAIGALQLIQKVPPELDNKSRDNGAQISSAHRSFEEVRQPKKLLRKPSKKALAKGIILLGGVLCLTRGNPAIGAKVATAYILTKLSKRGAASSSSGQH